MGLSGEKMTIRILYVETHLVIESGMSEGPVYHFANENVHCVWKKLQINVK